MATRIGGRQKGTGNVPPLDRIKMNQTKLEKLLLEKALKGDIQAIETCLRLIAEAEAKEDGEEAAA